MPYIEPDSWQPVGVEELEPAAWHAIRADRSMMHHRRTGCWETELLAQRAAFLFERSGSEGPISHTGHLVQERCGHEPSKPNQQAVLASK